MKTAEEIIKETTGAVFTYQEIDAWGPMLTKAMKEFAKMHVKAALEKAYQNQGWSWTNSTDENVKKELFFKNSYPETNIK